jgi:hypothetical protein
MTDRQRAARVESLSAENTAPGMFVVKNNTSDSEHTVDVRSGVCSCEDYQYRVSQGKAVRCKHQWFIHLIAEGVLCDTCGYTSCRPSCPTRERTASTCDHGRRHCPVGNPDARADAFKCPDCQTVALAGGAD